MAVHPLVSGRWLADICAFGDVTWATAWTGGLDTFSWAVPTLEVFPALRRGVSASLYEGGLSLGVGIITEVSDGQVHGEGLWRMAGGSPALDGSGNPTTVADTAIDQSISRGDLPGWSRPVSISAAALATTAPTDATSLAALLDAVAATTTSAWYVDSAGAVRLRGLAATPTWQATPPDGQLTTASDDYVTHLVATYYTTSFVVATRTYGDAAAAAKWGRRTQQVDLRDLGIITTGTVDSILAGMLAKSMARPTWAGTLEVTSTELTTLGGSPSYLTSVAAGDGVRLHGTFDNSRLIGYGYTDITADRVEYADGAATARITPVGYTPRDFKSILSIALQGAA